MNGFLLFAIILIIAITAAGVIGIMRHMRK